MVLLRSICCILIALLLCPLCACQPSSKELTLQVIDSKGNPMPNVPVSYGISQPETYVSIGRTDAQGCVIWKDPPTGKQSLLIWKEDTPDGVPEPQYIPLKIRRSYFGTTITLQAGWEAGESSSKTTPVSSIQSTTE